jgi:hypothetical protein
MLEVCYESVFMGVFSELPSKERGIGSDHVREAYFTL